MVNHARALLALALALAAPARPGDVPAGKGELRLVETAEFSVRLPASARRRDDRSASGQPLVLWSADTPGGTVGLLYADFPVDLTRLDTARLLDRSRDAMLAEVGATLLRERDLSCDPAGPGRWPGRALEARTAGGGGLAVRLCLVGARLYQLMGVNPDGPELPPEYEPMVASFRPRAATNATKE